MGAGCTGADHGVTHHRQSLIEVSRIRQRPGRVGNECTWSARVRGVVRDKYRRDTSRGLHKWTRPARNSVVYAAGKTRIALFVVPQIHAFGTDVGQSYGHARRDLLLDRDVPLV